MLVFFSTSPSIYYIKITGHTEKNTRELTSWLKQVNVGIKQNANLLNKSKYKGRKMNTSHILLAACFIVAVAQSAQALKEDDCEGMYIHKCKRVGPLMAT